MPEFLFDDRKSFTANCQVFLAKVESDDPEMAAILRDHWDELVAVVQEGQRDLRRRGAFSAKVVAVLDALAKTAEPKDSE